MNKIDLIIENIEYAKLVTPQAHKDELLDEALAAARAEIMQIAIDTTKTAISIEREECAKVCEQFEPESFYLGQLNNAAQAIRNRLKK